MVRSMGGRCVVARRLRKRSTKYEIRNAKYEIRTLPRAALISFPRPLSYFVFRISHFVLAFHAQPPRPGNQPVPPAARQQSRGLVSVGGRSAGASEAGRQADPAEHRLRG